MTALTQDNQTRTRAQSSRTRSGDVAANAIIFLGAVIARNPAGYIVPASDSAGLHVVGIAEQSVDNTGGADGALTVTYSTGVDASLVNDGNVVQAGKGALCYALDDQTVTSGAVSAHKVAVGVVTWFSATAVWVRIDETIALTTDIDELDAVTDALVSPAVTTSGLVEVIPIPIPDAATATYAFLNADKIEIIDVVVIKAGAGAGNTIQIETTAPVAISDAIVAAVDKAVTRAGTLDPAQRTIAAGAGFKVVATKAAGSMACEVFLHVIKRA